MNKLIITSLFILIVQCVWAMDYRLTAGGKTTQVVPFKDYYYAEAEQTGAAEYTLTASEKIECFEISPKSRKVNANLKGNTLTFKLDNPGYYLVRINDKDKIFVFAEQPEEVPTKNVVSILTYGVDNSGKTDVTSKVQKALDETAKKGKTLLFPEGTYTCKMLQLKSNTHVYLTKGAIIQANPGDFTYYQSEDNVKTKKFIYIKDARNVSIQGRGALNGNGRQLREAFGDKARMRLLMAVASKDIQIEGVMLQDPGSWNTQILACKEVIFRHVKVMNDIQLSNTDGIDPDATQNMLIENCFAYCGDDNIAIKTTEYSGYLEDVDNITVKGCVFLTKKSSLKVGTETRGQEMRNITFEDNDVIESDRGMALYSSDGAVFKNIRYINNRFERNLPNAKRAGIHFVADRRNPKSRLGKMENILIKDCSFEKPFPKNSEIKYEGDTTGIEVTIENLTIAGKKINTLEDGNIKAIQSTVHLK